MCNIECTFTVAFALVDAFQLCIENTPNSKRSRLGLNSRTLDGMKSPPIVLIVQDLPDVMYSYFNLGLLQLIPTNNCLVLSFKHSYVTL